MGESTVSAHSVSVLSCIHEKDKGSAGNTGEREMPVDEDGYSNGNND